MRVLIVTIDDYPHHGGKSTHICDLIEGLKTFGVDCEVLSRNEISTTLLTILKLFIQPLKFFNFKHYLYWRKKIEFSLFKICAKRKFKKNLYDVISAQDAISCTIIGRLNLGIPIVLTMHTYYGIEYTLDNTYFTLNDRIYKKLLSDELQSNMYASSIVAVDQRINEHILETLETMGLRNKKMNRVTSISNFTNTEKFKIAKQSEKSYYRKEYGIPDNQFVVSCARRLVEKNGVINLIKAMSFLEDKNVMILIAGDGPQKALIEDYIKRNNLEDNIKLLGSLDSEEIRKLYLLSDISVVPSISVNGLQEATSISAIEAMACGLPTIASNIGGLHQLIDHGRTGILVEEGNPKQIAAAIDKLKKDNLLFNNIKENCRKYIVRNHSHIEAAGKYLLEFKRCKIKVR